MQPGAFTDTGASGFLTFRDVRRCLSVPLDGRASGPRALACRARFLGAAVRHREATRVLLQAQRDRLLGRMLEQRPDLLRLVVAPYLCASWNPKERIKHFVHHVEVLEQLGPRFGFDLDESLEVTRLPGIGPAYHVVIDKPGWFHREGVLALNLFRDNVRLFTVAFALTRHAAGLVAVVGGIQGRKLAWILDEYRSITKAGYGTRPRDLLLELLGMYARTIGVVELQAISDGSRHHRSPYFGPSAKGELSANYDEIWLEHGGARVDQDFFSLPIHRRRRDEAGVPAKKRGMYRRRYELLDEMEMLMRAGMGRARPVRRPEAE